MAVNIDSPPRPPPHMGLGVCTGIQLLVVILLNCIIKSTWAYDGAVFFYVVSGVSSLLFGTKIVSDELLGCFFPKMCVYLQPVL